MKLQYVAASVAPTPITTALRIWRASMLMADLDEDAAA
jgi:hypothetical protein